MGIACPEIYGDPALLTPLLYPEDKFGSEKTHEIGIVPHWVDRESVKVNDPRVMVLDLHWSPETFISAMLRCERIVSSSLHGIVFAEAYGIPVDWVELSDNVIGRGFKFHDYYLGTGRDAPVPLTGDGLLQERSWTPPIFHRAALIKAFPFRLRSELDLEGRHIPGPDQRKAIKG
jgi:pyruvyltransferase